MVGVQEWGAGQGLTGAGLWTGEVNLHWVFLRGTHDLRQKDTKHKTICTQKDNSRVKYVTRTHGTFLQGQTDMIVFFVFSLRF